MELVLTALLGLVAGALLCFIVMYSFCEINKRHNIIGTLRIDNSDPYDGPYLFLELETDLNTFKHKKHVMLEVSNVSYISHK